jgi:hypothetical protein
VAAALESYVTESVALLIIVAVLAVLVLAGARRAGLGRVLGPVELLARLPLEARRSVFVVRVVDRVLILGASEAGLVKLGELPKGTLAAGRLEGGPSFGGLLESFWHGRRVSQKSQPLPPDPFEPPAGEGTAARPAPGPGSGAAS